MTGTDPGEREPYTVALSGQARRNVRENLPLEAALAAMETIEGSIAVNPYRQVSRLTGITLPGAGPTASSTGSTRPSIAWKPTPSATVVMLTGPAPSNTGSERSLLSDAAAEPPRKPARYGSKSGYQEPAAAVQKIQDLYPNDRG